MPGSNSRKSAAGKKRRASAKKSGGTRQARATTASARTTAHLYESDLIAFVATADPVRTRAFYESVVGLRLIADEPFALVFDANGVMVRIQKVKAVTPAAYTTMGWKVGDITAAIRGLNAKGVQCERYAGLKQDSAGVWTSPGGARIAWFKDPEGHVLSLTQF
jgi:predicted enzyme related to lactoylglutathione lyase